jgi:hypothetical protein
VNSQNRMNAGAEYVLYRIWAALRDDDGIHAESLLTCVGALAGYACQVSVRQAAALPGANSAKFALTVVHAGDGRTFFEGDALENVLIESPLSVWSFVRRAVQKLDEPLPDIEEIARHVSKTVGTRAFGVARVRAEHRARLPAIVYLRQIWPQILPIAQKFCCRPGQLPVVFGIALQRAIEQTEGKLSPTLGARIAMESAVAMSKVALPEAPAKARSAEVTAAAAPSATPPAQAGISRTTAPAAQARTSRTMASAAATAQAKSAHASVPLQQLAMRVASPIRTPASNKRRGVVAGPASTHQFRARVASMPPAVRMAVVASLLFVTVAGAMWKTGQPAAQAATRVERKLQSLVRNDASPSDETSEMPSTPDQSSPVPEPPARDADGVPIEQFTDARMQAIETPTPTPDDSGYGGTTADAQMAATSDGNSESVPPPDLMPDSGPADQIE